MTSLELARQYLRCLVTRDLEGVAKLLADDFRFESPLLRSESAPAYLANLKANPLEPGEALILAEVEEGGQVALFYRYQKEGATLDVAQWFEVSKGKLLASRLVFDSSSLKF
ncbi:MAG: nuclear transport factor 2 family protein [bacterium]|nr:nuclear transport factor 2 family protein [bacterium]